MSTKTRRSYTETFKEEAVCLVRESGQPVTHVARDLGIADHRLYRWRAEQQHAEGQGQTRQSARAEQAELVRLRRSSRRSRDEIPSHSGARPSLSDPLLCRTLSVSTAGYYAWRVRPESARSVSGRTTLSAIRVIHRESRETYGSLRIWGALVKQGHHPVPASVPRGREYP